jgi:hypothetical protein
MFNRSEKSQNADAMGFSLSIKSIFPGSREKTAAPSKRSWLRDSRLSAGQSMVEFAIGATVALAVMLIGIQVALIGRPALAVNQAASALARFAAEQPGGLGTYNGAVTMPLPAAAEQLLPSSLTTSTTTGSGKNQVTTYDLTVTVNSYSGSTTTQTNSPVQTDKVVINLSYNAASKIVLPSATLLGMSFPSTLTASDSQMY